MKLLRKLLIPGFTVILALLSNIPNCSNNRLLQWIIEYKLHISIVCAAFILLFQYYEYVSEDRIIKAWTKKFLRFIAKEKLGGPEYNTRISIFRAQKGWRIVFRYIWYSLVICSIDNWKNHTWQRAFRNIPIHLFSDYLTIYVRYSYPKEDGSMTLFRVTNRNEMNGITEKCYKEGTEIERMTCDISDLKLPETYAEIEKSRSKDYVLIKQYMNETNIDPAHYDSLLNIHTRANNIYAVAITNEDERIWGVLIIDNVSDKPKSFKEELKNVIEDYAKIFCFTLSTVK